MLYKLAGRVELLYALKALASGNLSYREVSERYGVSWGALESAFRDACGGRYQLCLKLIPRVADVVLSVVPSVAGRASCGVCGTVVSNVVLHIERKHGDLVERYTALVREEVRSLLRGREVY